MLETKKRWENPKLIILERSRPEEMVLAGCKMAGSKIKSNNKAKGCSAKNNCNTQPCNVLGTS